MKTKVHTAEEEHSMARASVYYILEQYGPVTLKDVIRYTGLVEIRAIRALHELVKDKRAVRMRNLYIAK